jgi:hypothetical protein
VGPEVLARFRFGPDEEVATAQPPRALGRAVAGRGVVVAREGEAIGNRVPEPPQDLLEVNLVVAAVEVPLLEVALAKEDCIARRAIARAFGAL